MVELYYQLGQDSIAERAKADMLEQVSPRSWLLLHQICCALMARLSPAQCSRSASKAPDHCCLQALGLSPKAA